MTCDFFFSPLPPFPGVVGCETSHTCFWLTCETFLLLPFALWIIPPFSSPPPTQIFWQPGRYFLASPNLLDQPPTPQTTDLFCVRTVRQSGSFSSLFFQHNAADPISSYSPIVCTFVQMARRPPLFFPLTFSTTKTQEGERRFLCPPGNPVLPLPRTRHFLKVACVSFDSLTW